jgi:hypothetical protein
LKNDDRVTLFKGSAHNGFLSGTDTWRHENCAITCL